MTIKDKVLQIRTLLAEQISCPVDNLLPCVSDCGDCPEALAEADKLILLFIHSGWLPFSSGNNLKPTIQAAPA